MFGSNSSACTLTALPFLKPPNTVSIPDKEDANRIVSASRAVGAVAALLGGAVFVMRGGASEPRKLVPGMLLVAFNPHLPPLPNNPTPGIASTGCIVSSIAFCNPDISPVATDSSNAATLASISPYPRAL